MTTPRYSDEELRQKALEFLRLDRKQYRKLRQNGELEEYLDLLVRATKRRAESLIKSGVWERQAWSWAIREEILGVPAD